MHKEWVWTCVVVVIVFAAIAVLQLLPIPALPVKQEPEPPADKPLREVFKRLYVDETGCCAHCAAGKQPKGGSRKPCGDECVPGGFTCMKPRGCACF